MKRLTAVIALTAVILLCGDARALRYQERPPWTVGVGFGIGTGKFEDVDDIQRDFRQGAVPQIRFGYMLGRRFMVSANYQGWVVEFDQYGEAEIEDAKIRRSLQNLTLGLT